jgi:hypothetical protein
MKAHPVIAMLAIAALLTACDLTTAIREAGSIIASATNAPPPVVVTPPADKPATVKPGALVPVKIPHGAPVRLIGSESKNADGRGGDCMTTIDGVQFRMFETQLDCPICKMVKNAVAVQVRDGMMVAHDFVNPAGQVMVFQYWGIGSSKASATSYENPVKVKNDSRVRYRAYEAVKP